MKSRIIKKNIKLAHKINNFIFKIKFQQKYPTTKAQLTNKPEKTDELLAIY
jgi:hypothetical protein